MLVKPVDFLKPVLDYHLSNRVDGVGRKTGCFHPSALSYCSRLLQEHYLAKSHESTDIDTRIKRVFDNGHSAHFRIQNYFKEIGILIDENVPISDDKYEICGEIDGLLKYWDELVILDVKTINKDRYRKLFCPSEEYIIQLNIYMYCLNLKYGILLYECKDDQEVSEFLVEYDVNVLAPVFKKIKYVKDCIQKGIIPPREDNHNCVWCKHKKTCK